ncbi:MAG: carbamoyl-phosphate synthase large subunit [Spirochaetia bacterium]
MPARTDLKSILIIGSGPIIIGQACEFDYSGNQAVRALKEEGYRVILVNPNPATVMTTPGLADAIYVEPLEVPYLEAIIKKERPDAIIPTMGGQTGLNLAIELAKEGVLDHYGVEVIGANIDSIDKAEDRGRFKEVVAGIGLESPKSALIRNISEAKAFADKSGLPIIIRPSFTLGGRGGSIAETMDEFVYMVNRALSESPVHQALVEESLIGWKEFELEVMRDRADNAVIVCSIENIDPMGVHTGDSITVAPVQTLSDTEYQRMRTAGIEILRAIGVDCGGSNVQFAINPADGRMLVIEMNPRVSRSSALASKATGFPIARCSARLAVGFTLDEIINDITGKTVSCFEPALDYVAVKVPRFEFEKFPTGYTQLGTQMKSVGESLAIGRTFTEALNKAIRAVEIGFPGITELSAPDSEIDAMLAKLHPRRIFAAFTKIKRHGADAIDEINLISGYDKWFLHYLKRQADLEHDLVSEGINSRNLRDAKRMGLTDGYIASLCGTEEKDIRGLREKDGLNAVYHFVDTCAGEFQAETPYFYSSYGEMDEGAPVEGKAVVILASGPNRIGQGLEFDTCCTLSSMAYRKLGIKTILINSNPETVSTDFNVADRLYIEPLTGEDVVSVMEKEKVKDVIVQLGGQTPLNMAEELEKWGANIIGTPVKSIQDTEDRGLFSGLLKKLGLKQPDNRMAGTVSEVENAARAIGYPVLLRPSFVLGGRSMMIAYNPEELKTFLGHGITISPQKPVLVDQFLEDAYEYDVDALSDGRNVYIAGIMQHIEAAGVHSGDSACVFPAYINQPRMAEEMRKATAKIAREIGVSGFINIQFAVKDSTLFILEVNPRASRTIPFISKASGVNLVDSAVRIWEGDDLASQGLINDNDTGIDGVGEGYCITGWAVKEAMFSFDRFRDVDPVLGPEMRSTGEVIGIGSSFGEAFAKAQAAAGTRLPTRGRVFVSVNDYDKETILPIVKELEMLGFAVSATRGTAQFLYENGVFAEVILKVHEGHPNLLDHMKHERIDLVINTPKGRYTQKDDDYIRIESLNRKIPYTTTTSAARAAVEGIKYLATGEISVINLPESADTTPE